ncbi:MAG: DUF480 domain-containing protein [Lacunisphaera sp.]|nr:DUF480 domain-containing protein [Lacunisphaera sp.]
MDPVIPTATPPAAPLSLLAARVLGCLIEKEFATPDIYPLTLNALVNACNQKSNREPVMEVTGREVEAALDELRQQRMAAVFAGADARVPKYKQKIEAVHPMEPVARALLGELLLRGPQTTAGLRGNAERLQPMPAATELEMILAELAGRTSGAIVRKLPRQPGQKEARWVQLLTGPPSLSELPPSPGFGETSRRESSSGSATGEEPVAVSVTLPPEVERRLTVLEAEVKGLREEIARLKKSLGE